MENVTDRVDSYERPVVADYGTLQELTEAGTLYPSDSPAGTPNTAFPVHS